MKLDSIRQNIHSKAISTRVDIRKLATIAEYWASQGERFRSISELVRLTVEVFTDHIVANTPINPVTTVDEAADILQKYALLTPSQRIEHSRNYGSALVRRDTAKRKTKGRNSLSPTTSTTVSSNQLAEATSVLNQKLTKATPQQVTEAATRTQEFKDQMTATLVKEKP